MALTCSIISLGCPKTLIDSEQMLGLLKAHGFNISCDVEDADVVIINTCGFLAASRDESMSEIRAMEQLRQDPDARLKCLLVAGCLVSRDGEKLAQNCRCVDALLDVFSRDAVLEAIQRTLGEQATNGTNEPPLEKAPVAEEIPLGNCRFFRGTSEEIANDEFRFPLLPPHVAYLKIAEGCNRRCAFCAIPNIRGRYSSKPMPQVLAEARLLAATGVKELVVIAQDTSFYGGDLQDGTSLAKLLPELAKIEGIQWIRILYLYPQNFGDDLIEALAETPKVVPYIDMPLQHINDRILHSMRRACTRQMTLDLLEKLRRRIPHLAIRTSFIVGYPGETQSEYDELLAFARKQKFARVAVFPYSAEEGTPAAELPGQIPEKVKTKRADKLIQTQEKLSWEWAQFFFKEPQPVIIDEAPLEKNGFYVGRTRFDAPDVDGRVFVTGKNLHVGDIVMCRIFDSSGSYEFIGESLGPVQETQP